MDDLPVLLVGVGVPLLTLVIGAWLGYNHRKREHLRELRVDRYSGFLTAADRMMSECNRILGTQQQTDESPHDAGSRLDDASTVLVSATNQLKFVATSNVADAAAGVLRALRPLREVAYGQSSVVEVADRRSLTAAIIRSMSEFTRIGSNDLWGRMKPKEARDLDSVST